MQPRPSTRAPEAAGLWLSGAGTVARPHPRPSWRTSTSAPSAVCSATRFPSCRVRVRVRVWGQP